MPLQVIRDSKTLSLLAPGLLFLIIFKINIFKCTSTSSAISYVPIFLKKPNLFLSIFRLVCDAALFSALTRNRVQSTGVAACSKAGAVTFEISEWLVYKKVKIVNYQFQNIVHHCVVPVLCDLESQIHP